MVAGGKLALASAAPGYFKKESEPVITGDRKVASISCIAFCHPFHGFLLIFLRKQALRVLTHACTCLTSVAHYRGLRIPLALLADKLQFRGTLGHKWHFG